MKLLLSLLLLLSTHFSYTQVFIDSYLESGTTAVSDGIYGKLSSRLKYSVHDFTFTTGGLLSVSNNREPFFSAFEIKASKDFQLLKLPLKIESFYLWKPFSSILSETTAGISAQLKLTHFSFLMGANTRCYYITSKGKEALQLPVTSTNSLWEPINAIYKMAYVFFPAQKWTSEIAITNIDEYLIEQETNPRICTKTTYDLNDKIKLYTDLSYIQTGLLNIRVNYFGVYLRGGILWKLN